MSETCQLECHVPTPGATGPVIKRFMDLLAERVSDPFALRSWIASCPHEAVDSRFCWPAKRTAFALRDVPLAVEPVLCGWPTSGLAGLWTPKLELSVLMELDTVYDDDDGAYRKGPGAAVFDLASQLCREFHAVVFLTSGDEEGEAFQSVATGHPRWVFDLACFPADRLRQWPRAPFDYEVAPLGDVVGALRRARWLDPPWPV